ncbi:hypothetical protein [Methylocystis sp.]|uniref:hypothetical protein n=1 Tax=Methylocystis sp. TaxID=1911079 RepID=UPI003D106929
MQERQVLRGRKTNGVVALAYVYFEDDPRQHRLVNRLSGADAKAVAQAIARALTVSTRSTKS